MKWRKNVKRSFDSSNLYLGCLRGYFEYLATSLTLLIFFESDTLESEKIKFYFEMKYFPYSFEAQMRTNNIIAIANIIVSVIIDRR